MLPRRSVAVPLLRGTSNAGRGVATSRLTVATLRVCVCVCVQIVRTVDAGPGVTMKRSTDVKDQIEVMGNDIQAVSRTCAQINMVCKVKNKDIRKFLDGIYVSEKSNVVVD